VAAIEGAPRLGDVTDLLRRAREDDRAAIDQLVTELYPDLHRMAGAKLAQNGTITLLDTTSIVHEAYMRLRNASRIEAACRGQFMAYASQVMRSVIVDFARQRRAARRGGAALHVTLSTAEIDGLVHDDDDVERVHLALDELEKTEPRLKRVIEMRYFGGFGDAEIAESLGIAERTVRRDWSRGRLLLRVAIKR
jgi:RNA polymerase sigma factor (TIGR02999 family)